MESKKINESASEDVIFYNETASNGKYQVRSNLELEGLKIYATDGIHTHKGEIYKHLNTYSVTKSQLDKLKQTHNLTRTSF